MDEDWWKKLKSEMIFSFAQKMRLLKRFKISILFFSIQRYKKMLFKQAQFVQSITK